MRDKELDPLFTLFDNPFMHADSSVENTVIIENIELVPEKFRESLKEVANNVEDLTKVSIIKSLSGGFSDSAPLLVYAIYEKVQSYQVFKIGETGIIKTEAKKWNDYIKNGHFNECDVLHLKNPVPYVHHDHSLIIYGFSGDPGKNPITLVDYYATVRDPDEAIGDLFNKIMQPLSDKVRREMKAISPVDFLCIGDETKEKIVDSIKDFFGPSVDPKAPQIRVGEKEFLNPLSFYPLGDLNPEGQAVSTPSGIIHGDLNPKNVLFYEIDVFISKGVSSKPEKAIKQCIIDYPDVRLDCLYIDLAKLESCIKFQLLRVDHIEPDELLRFEDENIACGLVPSSKPLIKDTDLQKLYPNIEVLRGIASDITNRGNYDPVGYWLCLYMSTLLHIKYKDITELQKRYAFLSASIILTRYLAL